MKKLCLNICWSVFALIGLLPLAVSGNELPEREEIPAQYKWDLSDMYPNAAAWEADKQRFLARLPEISAYRGRLAESGETLLAAIGTVEEISQIIGNLYVYAGLKRDGSERTSVQEEVPSGSET